MEFKINGQWWDVRRVKQLPRAYRGSGGAWGCAVMRRKPGTGGTIYVLERTRFPNGRLEMDTIIHEMLHACCWSLSEETVNDSANVIATVLWKMGYRPTVSSRPSSSSPSRPSSGA